MLDMFFSTFISIEEYIKNNTLSVIIQLFNAPIYFFLFRIKEELSFLKWTIVSCIMFGIGYWMMTAWSGVIFSFFSIAYLVVAYLYKKKDVAIEIKNVTMFFVSVLIIMLNLYFEGKTILYDRNYLPAISIVATEIHAYIYICSNLNCKKSRWLFIISHTLLVIYETLVMLPLFAVVDMCGLISNYIELRRMYKYEKNDNP